LNILLLNVIKIDFYNFELYGFKDGAFILRQFIDIIINYY